MRLMIIACAVVCTLSLEAQAATRIELIVDEPFDSRSVPWPVTTGVPFPRGQLTDTKHCRLIDDTGEEQTLQSRVAATWDAERSSIRWLTIDFIARPGRQYALEFGQDVRRRDVKDGPIVSATTTDAKVTTGVLVAEFAQRGPSAPQRVGLDVNANGELDDGEVVTDRAEHYYIDQEQRRFSNFRDTTDRRIVVEEKGPIRACVRVDGYYVADDVSSAGRIVAYRTRYHFFATLGLIKVVDEFRIQGSTRDTQFADIGFTLDVPNTTQRRVVVDGSGEAGNQMQSIDWTGDLTSVSSYQSTYRHFGNQECTGGVAARRKSSDPVRTLHETEQIGEWIQLQTDRFALTGSLRWMWQQFPKEWEVSNKGLTLHLWSPRGGQLDFGADGLMETFGDAGRKYLIDWRTGGTPNAISNFFYYAGRAALANGQADGKGINKHHEFWFHFTTADKAATGAEYGKLAAKQPLALASGEWNCSTDVFGPLMPRGPKSHGGESATPPDFTKYEAIVDQLFDLGRYAQDAFGDYGWWIFGSGPHYSYQWDEETQRHYADPRRFEYHTYQKETQLWWNYLRSGERKFYDWALPSENHWVDIATTHAPLTYQCEWKGGFRNPQSLQFRPGDWSIDSPLFYIRQRDSAEAWLRGCSQFQASYHRTLETTALAYYITGDERYNDVLKFWQDYWRDFAGKTSASQDWPTWLKEQPWFVASKSGEPVKTWAEMIRDYCPFTSGLRHQMTYFFSLSTLYEHTWDPVIGQVVRECADAYLDPNHRIGVWRTQENGLPAHADAPELAHYWVPALWKYARATQDPRMPDIFRKHFDACYAADPFREDVGRYSDVHLAYAYYYTRDPKHLRPALLALEKQLPNAEPLARPQDLGRRLYNPYTPIQCFTAVPRLMWALDAARRDGAKIASPTLLNPQRTAISLPLSENQPTHITLWGYDDTLDVFGEDGQPLRNVAVRTTRHASERQPFDRIQPDFAIYIHELTVPLGTGSVAFLRPQLEVAVLGIRFGNERVSDRPVLVNAARPISLQPSETFRLRADVGRDSLRLESSTPASISVGGAATKEQTSGSPVTVQIETASRAEDIVLRNGNERGAVWFRIDDLPAEHCWGTFQNVLPVELPSEQATRRVLSQPGEEPDGSEPFTEGRFGKGLHIAAERELRFLDHFSVGNEIKRLVDRRQGTIEFFVRQLHDTRLVKTKPVTFLTNGAIRAYCPRELPLREWAHVAVEWRPLKRDPERIALHVYVNGLDTRNYRSTWWEGYSQKPLTLPKNAEALGEFICSTQPGASFVIDEIRISTVPRYAKLDVQLGGQQTFNPATFTPPTGPFTADEHTAALLHLNGNSKVLSAVNPSFTDARVVESESSSR